MAIANHRGKKKNASKKVVMNTRITADLGNPLLLQLLKNEANEKHVPMRKVLISALESYFSHKIEQKLIYRASDQIMNEWDDERDGDYDSIKL
jgi:hypothetical protein